VEDKSTFGKDRQFDCEASERDASQAPSAKRSREIALTPARAWCFAVRKPTGPFDRFNHGSPVRPELSYVFTKTREIRNQDANLAIAKKHRRRKVLVCWSALRSLVFALIHNIMGSAPTRTRLIPWVAPPPARRSIVGMLFPPRAFFTVRVSWADDSCHRPILLMPPKRGRPTVDGGGRIQAALDRRELGTRTAAGGAAVLKKAYYGNAEATVFEMMALSSNRHQSQSPLREACISGQNPFIPEKKPSTEGYLS
jgi:hypothetical protein